MKFSKNFGSLLREIRQNRGLTQLAVSAHLGIVRPCITDVELGRRPPLRNFHIKRFCEWVGISPISLLVAAAMDRKHIELKASEKSISSIVTAVLLSEVYESLSDKTLSEINCLLEGYIKTGDLEVGRRCISHIWDCYPYEKK